MDRNLKKIGFIILGILLSQSLKAQYWAEPARDFRLGLKAHPTVGFMHVEDGKSNGINLGFSYGLMADFNFAQNYAFNTGLAITTINGKSTEINASPYHDVVSSTNPVTYDLKYMMQYLEIPTLLKLKTDKRGAVRWYGEFGLTHGFTLKARQDARSSTGTVLANNRNSSRWTRFYRAGLEMGGGTEYDIDGHTSIMVGLSYNNALTNLTTADRNIRDHYVALNLGVFF